MQETEADTDRLSDRHSLDCEGLCPNPSQILDKTFSDIITSNIHGL